MLPQSIASISTFLMSISTILKHPESGEALPKYVGDKGTGLVTPSPCCVTCKCQKILLKFYLLYYQRLILDLFLHNPIQIQAVQL